MAQGIPAAVDEDSIASLEDEEEHMPPAMPTPTPTPTFHPSAPMDHDEEMFKGKGLVKKERGVSVVELGQSILKMWWPENLQPTPSIGTKLSDSPQNKG